MVLGQETFKESAFKFRTFLHFFVSGFYLRGFMNTASCILTFGVQNSSPQGQPAIDGTLTLVVI